MSIVKGGLMLDCLQWFSHTYQGAQVCILCLTTEIQRKAKLPIPLGCEYKLLFLRHLKALALIKSFLVCK